jgi:hypothetical protein
MRSEFFCNQQWSDNNPDFSPQVFLHPEQSQQITRQGLYVGSSSGRQQCPKSYRRLDTLTAKDRSL